MTVSGGLLVPGKPMDHLWALWNHFHINLSVASLYVLAKEPAALLLRHVTENWNAAFLLNVVSLLNGYHKGETMFLALQREKEHAVLEQQLPINRSDWTFQLGQTIWTHKCMRKRFTSNQKCLFFHPTPERGRLMLPIWTFLPQNGSLLLKQLFAHWKNQGVSASLLQIWQTAGSVMFSPILLLSFSVKLIIGRIMIFEDSHPDSPYMQFLVCLLFNIIGLSFLLLLVARAHTHEVEGGLSCFWVYKLNNLH